MSGHISILVNTCQYFGWIIFGSMLVLVPAGVRSPAGMTRRDSRHGRSQGAQNFMLFAVSISRTMHPAAGDRSVLRVALLCIASLAIFPGLAFVSVGLLSGDLSESLAQLRRGCCFAPIAPLIFLALSRQFAEEMRYHGEWSELEIEDARPS